MNMYVLLCGCSRCHAVIYAQLAHERHVKLHAMVARFTPLGCGLPSTAGRMSRAHCNSWTRFVGDAHRQATRWRASGPPLISVPSTTLTAISLMSKCQRRRPWQTCHCIIRPGPFVVFTTSWLIVVVCCCLSFQD